MSTSVNKQMAPSAMTLCVENLCRYLTCIPTHVDTMQKFPETVLGKYSTLSCKVLELKKNPLYYVTNVHPKQQNHTPMLCLPTSKLGNQKCWNSQYPRLTSSHPKRLKRTILRPFTPKSVQCRELYGCPFLCPSGRLIIY